MGLIKGQTEYKKWVNKQRLTRQEAIDAQCYICNGKEDVDCGALKSCTLYFYSPYRIVGAEEKRVRSAKISHLTKKSTGEAPRG